jgi:flagellar hook-associated protein 3 FlgL
VNSPADDPVAAVHIMELDRSLQENDQYHANADMARNRLSLEEQALDDAGSLLQRVRELTVQGNNATIDATNRRTIATEIRGLLNDLMDMANRKDANGEFLFSGYSTLTQPFAQTATGINYQGDQGSRQLAIGANQRVADNHSGAAVFMNIGEGNGTFVTGAGAANTGSAVIGGGSVTNLANWVPEDYTLRFTDAQGTYEIVDSTATVVATGAYTTNSSIAFRGTSIPITGTPAANDTFTISRSRTEDIFTTLDSLATALETNAETPATKAIFNTTMATVLEQIDEAQDHFSTVRAQVGTRLSSLDNAVDALEGQKVEFQSMVSELRDLDYAEAITRMNQQLIGLQAAQASYSRIAQLSLFDYLR